MTEKRFRMVNHDEFDYELDYIMDNYKRMHISDVCDLLNTFNEENEMLKQFQNNTIKLIDKEIDKLQKKYDFGQKNGMCPMHNLLHTINTLKNLKTELSE